MGISFLEKYKQEDSWHGKVLVMEIYHLAMTQLEPTWSLKGTAHYFQCSIGLVSENLRLADEIHRNAKLLECKHRQQAIDKMKKNNYYKKTG